MKRAGITCSVCGSHDTPHVHVAKCAGYSKKLAKEMGFKYIWLKEAPLMTYLCNECEEMRQLYLENATGYRRGAEVKMHRGLDMYETKMIDHFYDEESFVCPSSYVYDLKTVVAKQTSLF